MVSSRGRWRRELPKASDTTQASGAQIHSTSVRCSAPKAGKISSGRANTTKVRSKVRPNANLELPCAGTEREIDSGVAIGTSWNRPFDGLRVLLILRSRTVTREQTYSTH